MMYTEKHLPKIKPSKFTQIPGYLRVPPKKKKIIILMNHLYHSVQHHRQHIQMHNRIIANIISSMRMVVAQQVNAVLVDYRMQIANVLHYR